jgi:hypothetical protein
LLDDRYAVLLWIFSGLRGAPSAVLDTRIKDAAQRMFEQFDGQPPQEAMEEFLRSLSHQQAASMLKDLALEAIHWPGPAPEEPWGG